MAKPEEMERLRKALTNGSERVEIRRIGDAAEAISRGERIACLVAGDGTRSFECDVNFYQARELIDTGATDLGWRPSGGDPDAWSAIEATGPHPRDEPNDPSPDAFDAP